MPPGGIFYNRNIFLMTVCTHWRSIVIGDAKMWTHVDVLWAGKAYAMRAVKRNPSLPLTLLGCYGPGVRQWVLKFTAANLSRVQRLELDIDAGDWLKYKACFEDAQAPILTHLRIRGDDVDHNCHPLLRVPAPALRSLELSNCRYPWNAGIHTNLTDLEINAPDADDRIWTYFPDGDVAAVIREFPRLEHLTIFVADHYAGGEIFVVAQTEMRSLRSLDLNLPEDHLVHLMKCMLLPPEIDTIQLTAAQCIAPGTVAALFNPGCIPDALLSRVVSLYLSTTDYGSTYTLRGFTDPHKKTEAILEVEIELFESTLEDTNQHPCALLLSAIREHYSLPKLLSVTFGGNREAGGYAQLWSDFTREMGLFMVHNPTLRHVTFDIETEYMYTKSLDEIRATLSETVTSRGEWPLPRLTSCSFISNGSIYEAYEPSTAGILRFLNFVTFHKPLRQVMIRCGEVVVPERRDAVEFIRGIRALHIPGLWWSETYFDLDEVPNTVTAGDLWPRRAKYDWRCMNDRRHRCGLTSAVDCCRGRNPRIQHCYPHSTVDESADMYDIANDWVSLLHMDSDDTVVI